MQMLDFLRRRAAHWHTVLDLYAYELTVPDEIDSAGGRLRLRATRPASYGGPRTTIDVSETWMSGSDPQGLMPTVDGHHLRRASWHAQIGDEGATSAERLDIDRSKPAGLMRHRHPYGSPNNSREHATISAPEAWMLHVETVISLECYPQDKGD